VALVEQVIAEVRAEKARTAGDDGYGHARSRLLALLALGLWVNGIRTPSVNTLQNRVSLVGQRPL
jgi:hypothetical protein